MLVQRNQVVSPSAFNLSLRNGDSVLDDDELVLPEKKPRKRVAVQASEPEQKLLVEEAPKPAALAAASWGEFDFPRKKKRRREVSHGRVG